MELLGRKAKLFKRQQEYGDSQVWLVSFADMMTMLFCFFVILYSLSSIDETKLTDVGKELAEAFRGDVQELKSQSKVGMMMQARQIRALQLLVAMLNLGDMNEAIDKIEKEVSEAKNLEAAKEAILKDMKKDQDGVLKDLLAKTIEQEDRIELALPGSMLFTPGSAELTPQARQGLRKIARYLNRVQGLLGVEVVGHTDSAPPSRRALFSSNWALSAARAGAVAEVLIQSGVDSRNILTRGMADLKPMFPERRPNGGWNRENMAKNRRVHIIIKRSKGG